MTPFRLRFLHPDRVGVGIYYNRRARKKRFSPPCCMCLLLRPFPTRTPGAGRALNDFESQEKPKSRSVKVP